MILRPKPDGRYLVLGDSFVYGLHDAIAFLGPLPDPWIGCFRKQSSNEQWSHVFFNKDAGQVSLEDPRLQPHTEWQRIDEVDTEREPTHDDPECRVFFQNKATGEIINSDPRMSPKALRAMGVPLKMFSLI